MSKFNAFLGGYDSDEFEAAVSELEAKGFELSPKYACLTLCICAGLPTSCGWTGWLMEIATKSNYDTLTPFDRDDIVPSIGNQICPRCDNQVFRTGHSMEFKRTEKRWGSTDS